MKRKYLLYVALLTAPLLISSCSSSDILPDTSPLGSTTWIIKGTGSTADSPTRSLSMGGNSGVAIYHNWTSGDNVDVYKDGSSVGTLTATPTSFSSALAELTGQADLTGPFTTSDKLDYYTPSATLDFRNQNATLAYVSAHCNYMKAPNVPVKTVDADNHIVTMGYASFGRIFTFVVLKLKDESGNWLRPTQVTISAASGKLVSTQTIDGATTYGDLVMNVAAKDGMQPYELMFALRSDCETEDTYTITAVADGKTYQNLTDAWSMTYSDGGYYIVTKTMTALTDASDLAVAAIDDQTYTGSAIEPTLTVTDGSTPLTLGTDYTVSYSNNTNVGEATATITGIGRYRGTKEVHFNIVKATPVLTITTTDLDVPQGDTDDTRVATVKIGELDITGSCTISYTSSNTSVATVTSGGVVSGVAPGTATITVSVAAADNWNSVSTSYSVNVKVKTGATNSTGDWNDGGTTGENIHI